MDDRDLLLRPCTQKQLAAIYGCPLRTFKRWMQAIREQLGPQIGYYYSQRQLKIIMEHFGEPITFTNDD